MQNHAPKRVAGRRRANGRKNDNLHRLPGLVVTERLVGVYSTPLRVEGRGHFDQYVAPGLTAVGIGLAIYALLLALSATALALFLWWATAGLLDRQTEAAINADAQDLAERWADGGLPALIVTIEDRLAQNIDDDAIYLLVDPNMKRMAGNLASWPPSVTETGSWYGLPVMRAGMKSLADVQRYELPDGFHLLIGRDVQVRAQLRALWTAALLWAVVVGLLMATAGALVVRSLFRGTLANVSATAAAIAGGDFAQRVFWLTGAGAGDGVADDDGWHLLVGGLAHDRGSGHNLLVFTRGGRFWVRVES